MKDDNALSVKHNNPVEIKQSLSNESFIEEKSFFNDKEVIIRKYAKGRFLGKGAFGTCIELTDIESKKQYAAKIVAKAYLCTPSRKMHYEKEIEIHKSLHHPNIVAFEHNFEDKENAYMLLELCSNQSLLDVIKTRERLTEIEVRYYIFQIIEALRYVHSKRIIHFDIKPGNVFLKNMQVKLGDFGLATVIEVDGQRLHKRRGTVSYMAPEVIDSTLGSSFESDIWSLGIVCYKLSVGITPFKGKNPHEIKEKIVKDPLVFPEACSISSSCRSFIEEILVKDPLTRPSLDKLLEHRFLSQGNEIPKLLPLSAMERAPYEEVKEKEEEINDNNATCSTKEDKNRQQPTEEKQTLKTQAQTPKKEVKSQNKILETESNAITNKKQKPIILKEFEIKVLQKPVITCKDNIFKKNTPYHSRTTIRGTSMDNARNGNGQTLPVLNLPCQPNEDFVNGVHNTEISKQINQKPVKKKRNESMGIFNGGPHYPEKDITKTKMKESEYKQKTFYQVHLEFKGHVRKWVVGSPKIGIACLFSNRSICICFKDYSQVILKQNDYRFHYISHKIGSQQTAITSYALNEFPIGLQSKVDLLLHFQSYFNQTDYCPLQPCQGTTTSKTENETQLIFLKKWMKTTNAMIFRMSNEDVQVCFEDHSELLLSSGMQNVTYINPNEKILACPFALALVSTDKEMVRKLKYIRNILTAMKKLSFININNNPEGVIYTKY